MAEYIEREAVVNSLRGWLSSTHPGSDEEVNVFDFLREIKATPSADVAPVRHGRWVYEIETDMFHCSDCNRKVIRNDYSFCHWCGAKMDLEEDE